MVRTAKSATVPRVGVVVPRDVDVPYHHFTDYFQGFDRVEAVRAIFGSKTEEVLRDLKVEFFTSRWGYMGVSDADGHLIVSTHYLRTGKLRDIYLDVVHELVHVKQFRDGRKLFPKGFEYPDSPTEIEAYKHCITEGRRLGMTDPQILEYLKVIWMDDADVRRLARNVGLKLPRRTRTRSGA